MRAGIETVVLRPPWGRGDVICDEEEDQHVKAECAEPKETSERADVGCWCASVED